MMSSPTPHVHWKRAFNPDWFGGWCMPEGKDVILTVASVGQELVTGEKGIQEMCLVVRWKEDAKPMICNRTNAKMLEKLAGSAFMDDWVGLTVQLYFDPTVRFGKERVGGVRIRQKSTATEPVPLLCADCGKPISDVSIDGQDWPAVKVAAAARKKYGRSLCWDCVGRLKEADHAEPQE